MTQHIEDNVLTIQVRNGDYEHAQKEATHVAFSRAEDVIFRTVRNLGRNKQPEILWAIARADGEVIPLEGDPTVVVDAPSSGSASGPIIRPGSAQHQSDLAEAGEIGAVEAKLDWDLKHPYNSSTGDAPEDMAEVVAELEEIADEFPDEPPPVIARPVLIAPQTTRARESTAFRPGGVIAAPARTTPRPRARDLVAAADMTAAQKATEGWRSILGLAAGPEEQKRRNTQRKIAKDLDGPKEITVANVKGGGRKTTVTRQLSYTLGKHRGGGVLAIDFNETHGNLIERVRRQNDATIKDLIEDLAKFEGKPDAKIGDLAPYISGQETDQFDVLASDSDPGSDFVITDNQADRVLDLTQRFWKIIVSDTGNNWRSPHYRKILSRTDQLVIVSEVAEDAASGAAWLVDALRLRPEYEELVDNAVMVFSDTTGRPDKPLITKLQQHFRAHTRATHIVPYDPALKGGKQIVQSQLSPRTVRAWEDVTATVVEGL